MTAINSAETVFEKGKEFVIICNDRVETIRMG